MRMSLPAVVGSSHATAFTRPTSNQATATNVTLSETAIAPLRISGFAARLCARRVYLERSMTKTVEKTRSARLHLWPTFKVALDASLAIRRHAVAIAELYTPIAS